MESTSEISVHRLYAIIIVTVQANISLGHTSDFAKLMVHKILLECNTKLKFSAMVK